MIYYQAFFERLVDKVIMHDSTIIQAARELCSAFNSAFLPLNTLFLPSLFKKERYIYVSNPENQR